MAAIYTNIHLDSKDEWKMMTAKSEVFGSLVMANSQHCSIVSSDIKSLDSLINVLTEARQYLYRVQGEQNI